MRFALIAFLCIGASGCAVLPAIGLNLAAQGAQGLVALTLGPLVAMQERSESDRCQLSAGRGIAVTESLETTIPANEGKVGMFEPAWWRPEFAREGYPQAERSRTSTEGALALGERSLLFVPPPGSAMVRVPYELVQDVEVRGTSTAGDTGSMIVRSCFGRFDIVAFRQPRADDPEADAGVAAATQLKARVAAFRAAAGE